MARNLQSKSDPKRNLPTPKFKPQNLVALPQMERGVNSMAVMDWAPKTIPQIRDTTTAFIP